MPFTLVFLQDSQGGLREGRSDVDKWFPVMPSAILFGANTNVAPINMALDTFHDEVSYVCLSVLV